MFKCFTMKKEGAPSSFTCFRVGEAVQTDKLTSLQPQIESSLQTDIHIVNTYVIYSTAGTLLKTSLNLAKDNS